MRAAFSRLLATVAALALLWAAAIWATGGFTFTLFGGRVAAFTLWRPLVIAVSAGAVLLWLQGPEAILAASRRLVGGISPARAACSLALATTAVGLLFNSWTAGGPDPFAYVSEAALLRSGRLEAPVPLAREAPWPDATNTFAPFGYRVALGPAPAIVPITAPGVPMLMAALQIVAGHWAAFLVTPVAGGVLVWLTFAIGRRVRSPAAGLVAAWLVATSPAVLFMLMWPMTDIPAAACTALMVWLLLSRSTTSAFVAGLAGSVGVLTRPNFIAIAAGAGVWLVIEGIAGSSVEAAFSPPGAGRPRPAPASVGRRARRVAFFTLGLLPGAIVAAALNARMYGSPVASGYGAASQLLSLSHLVTNATRYTRWLAETSPLALVGLAALVMLMVRTRAGNPRAASLLAIVTVTAWIPYLFYGDFNDWWYLRFLLPAWPAMFVAAAVAIDGIRARGRVAAVTVAAFVIVAGAAGVTLANTRGVFAFNERRYATIARLVDGATDPTAIILTVQHSGSVRYYAGRETLRWDVLDPAWLDRAVQWLSARGRHPYFLIEDWELSQFENRFGAANSLGRLSFSPALAWQSVRADGWIFLYDPMRRDAVTAHPGPEFERAEPFCAKPADAPWPR